MLHPYGASNIIFLINQCLTLSWATVKASTSQWNMLCLSQLCKNCAKTVQKLCNTTLSRHYPRLSLRCHKTFAAGKGFYLWFVVLKHKSLLAKQCFRIKTMKNIDVVLCLRLLALLIKMPNIWSIKRCPGVEFSTTNRIMIWWKLSPHYVCFMHKPLVSHYSTDRKLVSYVQGCLHCASKGNDEDPKHANMDINNAWCKIFKKY